MSLNSKTKFVNIVVRKKDYDISQKHNLLLEWLNANCELYVGIYHKNDINLNGEVEDPHLHLVLTMKDRKLLSTFLNSFCNALEITTLGVMIDKVNSYEGSIQYLLHKNDKNKTTHYFNELFYNYDESELKTIISWDSDSLTADRLYTICEDAHCNFDIIKALGLGRYNMYRKIICDIMQDIRIKRNKSMGQKLYEEWRQGKIE